MQNINQKAVIYCRVSDRKQITEGAGLDSQESRCREWANNKFHVVRVFREEGVSGKLLERPQMLAMLEYLQEQDAEHIVIIDDINRLARSVKAHISLREAIAEAGGILKSPSLEFDDSSSGRLIEHVLASVAAHQREHNAEQVINRMRQRVLNGYYISTPPIAYKYDKQPEHGKILVRDEPVASIVQEALESFASGRFETPSEVRLYLERHTAFPKNSKGVVHFSRVNDILRRVLYAGRLTVESWNIYNHPAKHEALISYETYLRIQERLEKRAKAPARPDLHKDFPLRGFVSCSGCNNPLKAAWSKGRSKYYGYYVCQKKACDLYGKSIRKDAIEGDFADLLKGLTPSIPVFMAVAAMFEDVWKDRLEKASEHTRSIEDSAKKIDQKINLLLDRIVDTDNPSIVTAYEKRIQNLQDEKIVMQEKISKCGSVLPDFGETSRTALEFLKEPHKLWASEAFEDKRTVLKLAFTDRLTYHPKEGYRTAKTALPFKVLRDFSSGYSEMVGLE